MYVTQIRNNRKCTVLVGKSLSQGLPMFGLLLNLVENFFEFDPSIMSEQLKFLVRELNQEPFMYYVRKLLQV